MKRKGSPEEKAWKYPRKGCRKEASLREGTYFEGYTFLGSVGDNLVTFVIHGFREPPANTDNTEIAPPLVYKDSCGKSA